MTHIKILPGDVFCTRNPMWLGQAINFFQKIWSKDDRAHYSHSGLICTSDGDTVEVLWKIQTSLLDAYKGKEILIGRHVDMTPKLYYSGVESLSPYMGQWYPFHRLLFHMIPPVAKYVNFGHLVCSELTGKFFHSIGFIENYMGLTPDDIADMICNWGDFEVIYEGVWD